MHTDPNHRVTTLTAVRASARGMEEAPDHRPAFSQPIVPSYRFARLVDDERYASCQQVRPSLGRHLQSPLHTSAEHDDSASVGEKLLDISRLYSRYVVGIGLAPVPETPAARPQLEITSRSDAFNVHPSPRKICNKW